MKNLKEQFKKLVAENAKTNWIKGVFWAMFIFFILMVSANAYLLVKPISSDIKDIIDKEVSSSNIIFSKKTLDSLKQRQQPQNQTTPPTGKSPFTPL